MFIYLFIFFFFFVFALPNITDIRRNRQIEKQDPVVVVVIICPIRHDR